MKKYLLLLFSLFAMSALLSSCKYKHHDGGTSDTLLVSPSILGETKGNVANTATRSTANGSEVGLFVTKYSNTTQNALLASGNVYDNVKATVDGDGKVSYSSNMYYPSRRDAIDVYAYLPWVAGIVPTAVEMEVATTQTALTIPEDDFLRGVKKQEYSNSANAVPIALEHVKSLVRINLTVPKVVGSRTVSDVTASTLLGLNTKGKYNIGTDAWSDLGTPAGINLRLVSKSEKDVDNDLYMYEAIVLPQTAPSKFYKITVSFSDGTTKDFDCTFTDAPVFATKKFHTYNILLKPYADLQVTSATIGNWTDEEIKGQQLPVYNTLRFAIFDQAYSDGLDKVEIKANGKTYTCSKAKNRFVPTPGVTPTVYMKSYDAYIPDDNDARPDQYPYTLDEITFYKGANKYVVSTNTPVTIHGEVSLAVMNGVAIVVDKATIADWGKNGFGGTLAPSSNDIVFHLMDLPATQNINKVEMTINGVVYTCSGAKVSKVGEDNAFIYKRKVTLPDDAGKIPSAYPFVITDLKFSEGTTAKATVKAAAIVSGAGEVNVAVYSQGKAMTIPNGKSTVTAWQNALLGGELPTHYVMNILTLSFWDYGVLAVPVDVSVFNKVVLTLSNSATYTCSIAKGKMELLEGSTKFITQYKIMIPDDGNKVPLVYPYTITKFEFYKEGVSTVALTVTPPAANPVVISSNNVDSNPLTSIALRSSWSN